MLKHILIISSSALLFACNNASSKKTSQASAMSPNTLTQQEKKEGWELLFDGTTTNGWHKYGNSPVGAAWGVKDGTLHLNAAIKDAGGDIVTEQEFDNFHFKYDWKIDTNGNSGVIFYVHEDAAKYKWPWYTGPEMQVLDNNGHPDAKIIKHRAGDLYDLISSSKETVKPALEWNTAEIKCVNGKLDLYLNGENIVSTTMWDDNWKKMVAGSKFKSLSDFGTYKKGKIALQDHGNNVWYRNIKVRKL